MNPKTLRFQKPGVNITIGDQESRDFWRDIKRTMPKLDIFIDDGGHRMKQQIVTFEEMFPHVKDGGVFLCEDTHTSYFPNFAGGLNRKGTFMEYAKTLLDAVNVFNSKEDSFKVSQGSERARSQDREAKLNREAKRSRSKVTQSQARSEARSSLRYSFRLALFYFKLCLTWLRFPLLSHSSISNDRLPPFPQPQNYPKNIRGVHVYDSMVFIEKAPTSPLTIIRKGDIWVPYAKKDKEDKK